MKGVDAMDEKKEQLKNLIDSIDREDMIDYISTLLKSIATTF